MIRKLKTRFIVLATISLFLLLTITVSGMNFLSYRSVVTDADGVLAILSQNKGAFPNPGSAPPDAPPQIIPPDLPYESRYFTVRLTKEGEPMYADISSTARVTREQAYEYAYEVFSRNDANGFIDDFRFLVSDDHGCMLITFLDCGRKLDAFYDFLLSSIIMSLAGLILSFIVIFFFSNKIIRPMAESYEKQKRFITDAGHEIKTPITIINANADILEMETGRNECIDDIKQQSSRLTKLTNNLIYLARMEEESSPMPMIEIPISEIALDTASTFKALAHTQSKELILDITPMLSIYGNVSAIEQLISILLDNALKYSPSGSEIRLTLEKRGKNICLSVMNTAIKNISKEKLDLLFERFYREDSSRNSATGGHGIGLSIAKAVVTAQGGKIYAFSKDGASLVITASFPI